MELHVYGPAFGLPSIEASSLAAIAYLTQALPQDSWVLVADSGLNPISGPYASPNDA